MKVRFLHAADIHLDSPLRGLSRYEGAPAERFRVATRDAFSALIDFAIEEQVDFVVIAGDLYDGSQFDVNTGLFFCNEMGRLDRAGIRAFVVHGNHDAQSQITKRLPSLRNVHVFSHRKAETVRIDGLPVALHGRSYSEPAVIENLAVSYPDAIPDHLNIGVLHTALEGSTVHANYAPCTVDELRARGYDYWALGHVHEQAVRAEDPWIVYPGNLQGRHVREPGARGAILVTAENGRLHVERTFHDVLRWQHLRVDASRASSIDDLLSETNLRLREELRAAGERMLAVRVTFEGASALHGDLFSAETHLRTSVLAHANAIDGDSIWIEKVRVATRPMLDAAEIAARADAIADLQALLREAASDEPLLAAIGGELKSLSAVLPKDFQSDPGDSEGDIPIMDLVRQGDARTLIERIGPDLLARLAAAGRGGVV
jgi:exonuclease SbcD